MARRKQEKRPEKNSAHPLDRAGALRQMLLERRLGVRAELDTVSNNLREESGLGTWDEGDRAVSEFNQELGRARINQLTQQLDQIEAALMREAEGRYGRCAACDADIPMARLRSLPFALFCRDCQEAAEATSRQTASVGM